MSKLDPLSVPKIDPKNTKWKNGPKITKEDLKAAAKKGELGISDINENYAVSQKLGFGKYSDRTYDWVMKYDKQYFNWACENIKGFKAKYELSKKEENKEEHNDEHSDEDRF